MSQVLDFYAVPRSQAPSRKRPVTRLERDFWIEADCTPLAEDAACAFDNAPRRVLGEAAFVLGAIAVLILAIGVLVPG